MCVQLLGICKEREIQEKSRLGTIIRFQWVSSELLTLLHIRVKNRKWNMWSNEASPLIDFISLFLMFYDKVFFTLS